MSRLTLAELVTHLPAGWKADNLFDWTATRDAMAVAEDGCE